MGSADEERAQIMILTAWLEAHHHRLRVRATRVGQDRADQPVRSAASTVDDACALVRAWLEGLLGDTGGGCARPEPGSHDPVTGG
jgi:hypothetical protein